MESEEMILEGLACGVGLALINGVIAWLSIRWTWNRRPQLFVQVFFGGMILRMMMTVAVSALLLILTPIHPGYFVAGLGITYILVLVLEIAAVVRRNDRETE